MLQRVPCGSRFTVGRARPGRRLPRPPLRISAACRVLLMSSRYCPRHRFCPPIVRSMKAPRLPARVREVIVSCGGARCCFRTDCEYVTKSLCEKSLNKRRCISYPWRCALNPDAPTSGAPVSRGVRHHICLVASAPIYDVKVHDGDFAGRAPDGEQRRKNNR